MIRKYVLTLTLALPIAAIALLLLLLAAPATLAQSEVPPTPVGDPNMPTCTCTSVAFTRTAPGSQVYTVTVKGDGTWTKLSSDDGSIVYAVKPGREFTVTLPTGTTLVRAWQATSKFGPWYTGPNCVEHFSPTAVKLQGITVSAEPHGTQAAILVLLAAIILFGIVVALVRRRRP